MLELRYLTTQIQPCFFVPLKGELLISIKTNDNINENENQLEFLSDKKADGKERPWKEKKIYNELLTESYERLGFDNKSLRAEKCGKVLEFKVFEDGTIKLHNANFCQIRLCAMCNWRREIKIFAQLSKVVEQVENKGYRFIFLTLTCENVDGEGLISAINNLFKSYDRLFKLKQVKKALKGYFRALEITHDVERKITKKMYKERKEYYNSRLLKVGDMNPNFNRYHPHFHVMIAVNKSYFTDKDYYIKQADWVNIWQQSLRVDYTPIVDVRTVRNINNKGIKEVAKYTVKDTDFIVKQDKPLTDETIATLDEALAYRRLIAYGGIMKEIHKELNFNEDVNADVNISEDGEITDLQYILKRFEWNIGYKNYVLIEKQSTE